MKHLVAFGAPNRRAPDDSSYPHHREVPMKRPLLRSPLAMLGLAVATLLPLSSLAQAKDYQGAEVYSAQQVLYGRMEMRMWMARGSGILSTFFMYKNLSETPGNTWEELDIEVKGKDNAQIWQSNIISGVNRTKTSEELHNAGVSLADGWHTFTLEWAPTYVAWLLDGVEVRRTDSTQATNQVADLINPEGLRFNLWASDSVGWVGAMDPTALPAYQAVNWFKYYRYDATAADPFVLDWTDEFDTLDTTRWGTGTWTFGGNLVDFSPDNVAVKQGALLMALTPTGTPVTFPEVPADSDGGTTGTATSLGTSTGAAGSAGASGASGAAGAGAATGGSAGSQTGGTPVGSGDGDVSNSGCTAAPNAKHGLGPLMALGLVGLLASRLRRRENRTNT
jgi:endo-1,3-1,4-beta-glycanase ExoK